MAQCSIISYRRYYLLGIKQSASIIMLNIQDQDICFLLAAPFGIKCACIGREKERERVCVCHDDRHARHSRTDQTNFPANALIWEVFESISSLINKAENPMY